MPFNKPAMSSGEPAGKYARRAEWGLSTLVLLLGIACAIGTAYVGSQWMLRLPILDQLLQLELIRTATEQGITAVPLQQWLEPHAGAHRIVFLRLFSALDFGWFGGQNRLLYGTSALLLAALLLAYLRFFWLAKLGRSVLAVATGLLFFWLFSPTQLWNWVNPTNHSWLVAHALIGLAFFLLTVSPALRFYQTAIAIALCAMASVSTFSGIPALGLLPFVVLLRNTRQGAAAFVLCVTMLLMLMQGIRTQLSVARERSSVPLEELPWHEELWKHIWQTGQYLGSPLSIEHTSLSVVVVVASVLFLCANAVLLVQQGWLRSPSARLRLKAFLALLAAVALGIAISTSLGRSAYINYTAARYQTFICHYWLPLSLLLLMQCQQTPRRRMAATLLTVTITLPFALNVREMNKQNAIVVPAAQQTFQYGRENRLQEANYKPLLSIGRFNFYAQYDAFFREHRLTYYR